RGRQGRLAGAADPGRAARARRVPRHDRGLPRLRATLPRRDRPGRSRAHRHAVRPPRGSGAHRRADPVPRPRPAAVPGWAAPERLPTRSFAGQQDTYLNIRGDGLLDAVKRCWASLWNARAIAYRDQHPVPDEDVALAVVVQELVEADAAGVMFTANPVTGARDETVINASWGLGEAVVGGQVTPDTIVVAGDALLQANISDKTVMTGRTPVRTDE